MKELLRGSESSSGQAMVEFAVVFPLQLLITLGIIQLCLVIVGAIVVDCAAESAARAALVGEDPHRAASLICSTVTGSSWRAAGGEGIRVPGWGMLPNSRQALAKTRVEIATPLYADEASSVQLREVQPLRTETPVIEAYVEHDFELIIPVVDLMGSFVFGGRKIHGARHMTLRAKGTQPVPWAAERIGAGHKVIPDIGENNDDY